MQFDLKFITDEIPENINYKINKRYAVRGVIHYGNKLLMVQTNRGDYKFPGGGKEKGETDQEALLREIAEETGFVDVNIGPELGRTFEQNIDTESPLPKIEINDQTVRDTVVEYFQMESHYYECWLKSEKRAPGVLDDYEEKLGFRGTFVAVEEAYKQNARLMELSKLEAAKHMRGGSKTIEETLFISEIPWLERETVVLKKLQRTLLEKIADAVRECGEIMLKADRSGNYIDEKGGHANFVTVYDKKVQTELKERLFEILPEAVFVGEEDDMHASINKGLAFIVDPIDGTTNFIKDYNTSAISVGLTNDGQPYMGVVYNPYLNEMFTAEKGKGAYLNGKQIQVSKQPLSNGIVLFGTAPYYETLSKKSFQMAYDYFKKALDVRRSGSAALDLCTIAAGRAELFFELKLSPWDYAAGALIVKEAGGIVTTVEGTTITLDKPCSILATNRVVAMEKML